MVTKKQVCAGLFYPRTEFFHNLKMVNGTGRHRRWYWMMVCTYLDTVIPHVVLPPSPPHAAVVRGPTRNPPVGSGAKDA